MIRKPLRPRNWQELPYEPYNPLDKTNLAESVCGHLLSLEPERLPPGEHFLGAGVYAIYYIGDYHSYATLKEKNQDGKWELPIYVGKADAPGSRKGGFPLEFVPHCTLFDRLWEHAASVENAKNLELNDFYCQHLVLDEVWVPLAESLLIQTFSPVWNVVIDGFGIHDPGAGRRVQRRSQWDTLHPGRPFAERQGDPGVTEAQLQERIKAHFGV